MNVRELLAEGCSKLKAAGVETPELDAELLLAAAADSTRSEILAGLTEPDAQAVERFQSWIDRRAAREPFAYIVGSQGFRRIELKVDRRVLIPRPETELLVELIKAHEPRSVLDVATGSGAVALALADETEGVEITACDISPGALALARANAEALGLTDVRLVESDLLDEIEGRFDAISANLPYVESAQVATLQPEITEHEPPLALDGGADGLDLLRRLIAAVPEHLNPGGLIALEHGMGQAGAVAELLKEHGFVETAEHKDLAGIERTTTGRRPR